MKFPHPCLSAVAAFACLAFFHTSELNAADASEIRTPSPPLGPRINSPSTFGVRPNAPILLRVAAVGEAPLAVTLEALPEGVRYDAKTRQLSGALAAPGMHVLKIRAANAHGVVEKELRLVCGDRIARTPPMGWNSWNVWSQAVDREKVLAAARAFVDTGMIDHGWTYVNIDDTWQGKRDPKTLALQPNEKFPDMSGLVKEIHALGLKAGIYSTPWVTSYTLCPGGSSDVPTGEWTKAFASREAGYRLGKHTFEKQDAAQYAAWEFDYLKYDWLPIDVEHTRRMGEALKATGRDIVFSLSNSGNREVAPDLYKYANLIRTTGDIWDTWDRPGEWQHSVSEIGFNQDRWAPLSGPGTWNDPDMLVVGWVGWGEGLHLTQLTAAEQYTHVSLWSLLSAPLIVGCDLSKLDAFTLSLLTNDEVIAVDQDALGQAARRVFTTGAVDVFRKELEDGNVALGFFNRGDTPVKKLLKLNRGELGFNETWMWRDLWRQKDLGSVPVAFELELPAHDVLLVKLFRPKP